MNNSSSLEQSLLSAKKFMDHDRMKVGDTTQQYTTQQYSREQEPPMELLASLPPGQAPAGASHCAQFTGAPRAACEAAAAGQ